MKKIYFAAALGLSSLLFPACSSELEETGAPATATPQVTNASTVAFPEDDGAEYLNPSPIGPLTRPQENLMKLLNKFDEEKALDLGRLNITSDEYNEIAAFTADLVKDAESNEAKYQTIYNWVKENIKFADNGANNDPYPVFTSRQGVCEGFAGLLKVMLISQNIPTLSVNGLLMGMGHAWNYVCVDGQWYVSDALNGYNYKMEQYASYNFLSPSVIDIPVFEDDDFVYTYSEYNLNVARIKSTKTQVVIPFSVNGLRITSLNPTAAVPAEVQELYIGKNIETLGTGIMGLREYGSQLIAVYADPASTKFYSYEGALYQGSSAYAYLVYVPPFLDFLKLMPMEKAEKNIVFDQPGLQTIEFAEGTKVIEAWAVEKCPNLHRAYVPKDTEIEENAFDGVADDFEIIRGSSTGIHKVKL